MLAWHENRFTGLFTQFTRVELRPHDPSVPMTAGEMPPWRPGDPELGSGGAGWTTAEADAACLGEAIERVLARHLPCDASVRAAWSAWPLDEPALPPDAWVLFHPEQYAQPGFPLHPLTPDTECDWVCCREAVSGRPVWVPEDLVYLIPRPGACQRFTHGFSTGLSCGRIGSPVVLRGAQEVIERDALVGGWWDSYPVEEWPAEVVLNLLGAADRRRVSRPNLLYRFYRIRSPWSNHVTLVSLTGRDVEGVVFSVGSACRETRRASWRKALLEAIQGRHCVRRLMARNRSPLDLPTTFLEHALYYALHPDRLSRTILERAEKVRSDPDADCVEDLARLRANLGESRPILFRNLTPPFLPDSFVVRVVVPGMQPLHGDHRLPFLGGPLWRRPCADWAGIPPHPFA